MESHEGAHLVAQIRTKIRRHEMAKTSEGRFWTRHMQKTLDEHIRDEQGSCTGCGQTWPCERLRGDAAGWD